MKPSEFTRDERNTVRRALAEWRIAGWDAVRDTDEDTGAEFVAVGRPHPTLQESALGLCSLAEPGGSRWVIIRTGRGLEVDDLSENSVRAVSSVEAALAVVDAAIRGAERAA
jgi:hypothetical protein